MRAVHRVSAAGNIVMLTLVASAFAGATEAPAEEHTPAPYLALGDSLPYGWDPVTPPFPFASPGFHVGYPEIHAEVAGLSLTNASCRGETSGSFLDRELPDNGCSDVRDIFGLKVDDGAGIIRGLDQRTFGPGAVTRAQAASLLMRAANRAAADGRWAPVTPRQPPLVVVGSGTASSSTGRSTGRKVPLVARERQIRIGPGGVSVLARRAWSGSSSA